VKLTVFQSQDGDCLMVESSDGKRMLVDGGRATSYHTHVAPALEAVPKLDLIYVSHIDADHIEGVLALLDDEVDWRVHDFQVKSGNPKPKVPPRARPPKVGELWHNGFGDQVDQRGKAIPDLLAASAAQLDFSPDAAGVAAEQRHLALSFDQGIRVSARVSPKQLGIPLNKAFGGKLALVRNPSKPIGLGKLKLTVLGPFPEQLEQLRKDWEKWVDKSTTQLDDTRREMQDDVKRLGNGEVALVRDALAQRADAIKPAVTPPNLASLMLLAREGKKTVLLTGDGRGDHIIQGLQHSGDMKNGKIHVNVMKVQHHGAWANIDDEFCKNVTADHYVFCGNGSNENPDPPTLDALFEARLVPGGKPFKLWFNSSVKAAGKGAALTRMIDVEKTVRQQAAKHPQLVSFFFLEDSSFELQP
jgi:beta-lactamase superfamily II metal-dependent hydrolase